MRGAGKTHMGAAAASATGRLFIDMDAHFEKAVGVPIMEFVKQHDWPTFRERERLLLSEVLGAHPSGAIVSCGGGIVETEEGRAILKSHSLVIEVRRDIDDIVEYLTQDKSRPNLGEPPQNVYARRKPWYGDCSTYEFDLLKGEGNWTLAERDFVSLVERICGQRSPFRVAHWQPLGGLFPKTYENSFFVSLTFPNVRGALDALAEVSEGADALEIRIDLFESHDPDFIRDQVHFLPFRPTTKPKEAEITNPPRLDCHCPAPLTSPSDLHGSIPWAGWQISRGRKGHLFV